MKLKVNEGPLIVAVDYDGTIVKRSWPRPGDFVPGALEWLRKFLRLEARLILWTSRGHTTVRVGNHEKRDPLQEAVDRLRAEGIEFWAINENPEEDDWMSSAKPFAHLYVDDAMVCCPLVHPMEGNPYVDWRQVGPAVLRQIVAWRSKKEASG